MLNTTGAETQHPMHFICAPARSHTDDNKHSNEHQEHGEGRVEGQGEDRHTTAGGNGIPLHCPPPIPAPPPSSQTVPHSETSAPMCRSGTTMSVCAAKQQRGR